MEYLTDIIKGLLRGVLVGWLVMLFILAPTMRADARIQDNRPNQSILANFSSNPDQDSGWVKAQSIGGGCNPDGSCSGTETGAESLYEYTPDRDPVERDPLYYIGDVAPPGNLAEYNHNHSTAVRRTYCHVDRDGRRYYFGWARGIWHHGASWTYRLDPNNRRIWTGPTNPHWAFWHEDRCDPPEATATPTNTPTITPTMLPRGLSIEVRACTSAGALLPNGDVFISAWTVVNGWQLNEQTSSVNVQLPGQYSSINYDVTLGSSWSVISGRTSQRGALLPYSAVIVAWNSTTCAAPTSSIQTPTPTAPSTGCPGSTSWIADSTIPILAPRINGARLSTDQNNPTLLRPGETTFEFNQDRILQRDLNNDDRAEYNTYFVVYHQPSDSTRVANSSWYVWRHVDSWGRVHWDLAWRGWAGSSGLASRPVPERVAELPPEGLPRGSFVPEIEFNGPNFGRWSLGLYRVVARGNADRRAYFPCPVPFREQSFYFRVSRNTPTPTNTPRVGQPTPTPTNTPTPTPTLPPPPPPPPPTVDVQLELHSPYDRAQQIYRTTSDNFTWPMGERLNWTPHVELSLPADTDPNYNFRTRVLAWSFVSSLQQRADEAADALGRAGCREREQPSDDGLDAYGTEGLEGCVYAYKDKPEVADILQQAHAFWSANLPPDMASDVYVYDLEPLRPADLILQLKIVVEVVEARNRQVVAARTEVRESMFTVNFAVPRSAK